MGDAAPQRAIVHSGLHLREIGQRNTALRTGTTMAAFAPRLDDWHDRSAEFDIRGVAIGIASEIECTLLNPF